MPCARASPAASHDVLMILDSDLTVPPEDLPKFYLGASHGKGRVHQRRPASSTSMEGEAMRFLNLMGTGQILPAALLRGSWSSPSRTRSAVPRSSIAANYDRIAHHRAFFGDFDPFGDFDLLFGAARLNLRIIDVPIRYRAPGPTETPRSAASATGGLLLKMTAFGFRKMRMGL